MTNIPTIEVYIERSTIVVDIRSRFSSEAYKWLRGEIDKLLERYSHELPVGHTCFMIRDTLERSMAPMLERGDLYLDDDTGLWAFAGEICLGWESAAVTAKEVANRSLQRELECARLEIKSCREENARLKDRLEVILGGVR